MNSSCNEQETCMLMKAELITLEGYITKVIYRIYY